MKKFSLCALALLVWCAPAFATSAYTFHEIPIGSGLSGNQGATGVNESGVVCGTLTTSPDYGFVWDQTNGATYFNHGGSSGGEWNATDINDSGQVTGYFGGAAAWRGFLRSPNGSWTDLGQVPGYFEALPQAINNAGTVVGQTWANNYTMGPPCVGSATTPMHVLDSAFPNNSPAYDINDAGKVVGCTISGSSRSAWAYDSGTITTLPHLSGSNSKACGINQSGQIAGESGSRPVMWTGGGVQYLGTLGGSSGVARAINDNGVVVGTAKVASGANQAFVWQDSQMQNLNDLVSLPAGWTLTSANDVNNWGMIVGHGYKNGQQRAFALTPNTAPPPQTTLPGSVAWINADELHDQGITGSCVKIGMVEHGGLPWANHPALQGKVTNGEANKDDASEHATSVAGIMVGAHSGANVEGTGRNYKGVAPGATLEARNAITTNQIDNMAVQLKNTDCDVINISCKINPDDPFASGTNRTIDDIVDSNRVCIVASAGNSSQNQNIVTPGNAYNVITVGSLESSELDVYWREPWDKTGTENIPGPTTTDYGNGRRCKPDIVAPGNCMLATHHQDCYDPYLQPLPGKQPSLCAYSSHSAPHVTGAVALMIKAARDESAYFLVDENGDFGTGGDIVDPRIIKSALLTGADKSVRTLYGRSWMTVAEPQEPLEPLDRELGAGGLDALEAKKVMLSESEGDTKRFCAFDRINGGGGMATATIGHINLGMSFVATLVWNKKPSVDLADLDLELLRESTLIAASRSDVDNVEHIYAPSFAYSGNYSLKVLYDGDTNQQYEWFGLSYRVFLQKGHGSVSGGSASMLTSDPDGFSAGSYSTVGMESGAIPLGNTIDLGELSPDTGSSFVTLKVAYDEDALNDLGVLEETLRLYWWDDGNTQWILAGDGSNDTKNPLAEFVLGTPTDQIGDWGLNFAEDYVWANIDHASVYAPAGVPEPVTISLLAIGGLALLRRKMKH